MNDEPRDIPKTWPPDRDWLKEIQDHAKQAGLDNLTMDEIDAEIAAARRDRQR
jgi:hypothetical protein